jgi:hypothetical protein
MNVDSNETVTISHCLNLSHTLRDSHLGSVANQLRPERIRALPGDKLSLGVHT